MRLALSIKKKHYRSVLLSGYVKKLSRRLVYYYSFWSILRETVNCFIYLVGNKICNLPLFFCLYSSPIFFDCICFILLSLGLSSSYVFCFCFLLHQFYSSALFLFLLNMSSFSTSVFCLLLPYFLRSFFLCFLLLSVAFS